MIKLKTFEEDFDFSNTPYHEVKYKKIRDGLHLINYITNTFGSEIQYIIDRMLDFSRGCFNQYDQCYLDVKVRDLNVGDSGDYFNEWHTDWVKDINHPNKPETYIIYTNIFGTHYIENGLEQQCENNSIYMYKRDLHKSPIVTKDCKRVLIRLSFVDRQRQ